MGMYNSLVLLHIHRSIFICEYYNVTTHWLNPSVKGTVRLGKSLSCTNQNKLQGMSRKQSGYQVSILANMAHHDPSHPSRGTFVHFLTDPDHGQL